MTNNAQLLSQTCNYPDCNCPFDAPADPNWCARGLPKKGRATQNATLQNSESIAAQCNPESSATENATQTATDALGSLPVVAKVKIEDGTWMNVYEPDFTMMSDGMHSLTDHTQATAEIAKRDAEIERLHALSKEYFDKMNEWRDAYEAAQGTK